MVVESLTRHVAAFFLGLLATRRNCLCSRFKSSLGATENFTICWKRARSRPTAVSIIWSRCLKNFSKMRRQSTSKSLRIGERILICPDDLRGHSFQKQVELLDQAAETVLSMVKQLRKGIDAQTAREMNAKLQSIEGDADQLELDRIRNLFHGEYEPKQIIFLHDLYGLLEKVIDRCRDAGNIILQVALKYS